MSDHLCGTVPHPDYGPVLCHWVTGSEGEQRLRCGGHQRDVGPTSCLAGFIRKPEQNCWAAQMQIPPKCSVCLVYTHLHPLCAPLMVRIMSSLGYQSNSEGLVEDT